MIHRLRGLPIPEDSVGKPRAGASCGYPRSDLQNRVMGKRKPRTETSSQQSAKNIFSFTGFRKRKTNSEISGPKPGPPEAAA